MSAKEDNKDSVFFPHCTHSSGRCNGSTSSFVSFYFYAKSSSDLSSTSTLLSSFVQMTYSLLSELTPASKQWHICARVSRLWEYRGNVDENTIQHLDLVLVDAQINEITDLPSDFPSYAYNLVPFSRLSTYVGETRSFIDIIGAFVGVSNVALIQGANQNIPTTRRTLMQHDAIRRKTYWKRGLSLVYLSTYSRSFGHKIQEILEINPYDFFTFRPHMYRYYRTLNCWTNLVLFSCNKCSKKFVPRGISSVAASVLSLNASQSGR